MSNGHPQASLDEEEATRMENKTERSKININNNSSPFADDELLTWLQYPLDDESLDKGYFHWPPLSSFSAHDPFLFSPAQLKHLPQEGISAELQSNRSLSALPQEGPLLGRTDVKKHAPLETEQLLNNGDWQRKAFTPTEPRWPNNRQPKSRASTDVNVEDSRLHVGKHHQERDKGVAVEEGGGSRPPMNSQMPLLRRASPVAEMAIPTAGKSSTDAALALGASRAAGIGSQAGVEAFSKVRTSLQPGTPCMLPPRINRTLGSYGGMDTPISRSAAPPEFPPILTYSHVNMPAMVATRISENQESRSSMGNSIESSTTAVLRLSVPSILREAAGVGAPHIFSGGPTGAGGNKSTSEVLAKPRVPAGGAEKRANCFDVPSGSSQTSDSPKGAISSGGKRQLEDSHCHSEDAEADSATNSQARSFSTSKRSRAADTHNASERRRRERINEKLQALAELIPNSTKTHKASLLDEAIEYIKTLQVQLQMMSLRSGVSLASMVLPPQMVHMQVPPQLGPLHHQVGMGMAGAMPVSGTGAAYGAMGRPFSALPSLPGTVNYPIGLVPGSMAYAFRQAMPGSGMNMASRNLQPTTTTQSLPVAYPSPHTRVFTQATPAAHVETHSSSFQQREQHREQQL